MGQKMERYKREEEKTLVLASLSQLFHVYLHKTRLI